MRDGTHQRQDAVWTVQKGGGRVDMDGIHASPGGLEIALDDEN